MSHCVPIKKSTNLGLQNLSSLENDKCYIDTRTRQDDNFFKYNVFNYNDCGCGAKAVRDLSVKQPEVHYRDGYGWTSQDGCNIDNDSYMRNARNMTNPRLVQQLYERPYLSIPYMGRGAGDVTLETVLLPGESTLQKRPSNNLSGVYIDQFVPLVPFLEENIQNPIHLITEDNDAKWIRGGQPSRQIIRNQDYLKKCGYQNTGKYWKRT